MKMCVEKVLPIWDEIEKKCEEELLATRDTPRALMELANERISGAMTWEELSQTMRRFSTLVGYLYELDEYDPRLHFIALAAIDMVEVALSDIDKYPEGWTEEENEAWCADALASWAWAGCPRWADTDETRSRRQEFWHWYLTVAVPAAAVLEIPPDSV